MTHQGRPWLLALSLGLTVGIGVTAQDGAPVERQLQAAIHREMVEGDLQGAIEGFREIASSRATPPALVARALVHLGDCYRKLGDARARQAYERVAREFADQPVAREARAHLAAMGRDAPRAGDRAGTSRLVMDLAPAGGIFGGGMVSRDGQWLPATDWSTGDLVVTHLPSGRRTRLTDTATFADMARQQYAGFSRVSPDGKTVVFAWFNGTRYDLRLVETNAGGPTPPRMLFVNEDVEYVQPFDWSPDGTRVAVQLRRAGGAGQIGLVSVPGGVFTPLKSFPWSAHSLTMTFSPGGRTLGYDLPAADDPGERDVSVIAVDGSGDRLVAPHARNDVMVGWSPDGTRLLFASDRTGSPQLWAVSLQHLRQIDTPRVVPSEFRGQSMGVSRDGALFYLATSYERSPFLMSGFDADAGVPTGNATDPGEAFFSINAVAWAEWSPDGRWLALARRDRGGPVGVLVSVLDVNGTHAWDVRPKLTQFGPLHWKADATAFVAGGTDPKGRAGIFEIDAKSGAVTPLMASRDGHIPYQSATSPDGATVYYRHVGPSAISIVARSLTTNTERLLATQPRPGGATSGVLEGLHLSPDGSWIATSTRTSPAEAPTLRVISAVDGAARDLPSAAVTDMEVLAWAPDSRSLFVRRRSGGTAAAVLRVPIDGRAPTPVVWPGSERAHIFRIHPNGHRLVSVRQAGDASGARAELRVLDGGAR